MASLSVHVMHLLKCTLNEKLINRKTEIPKVVPKRINIRFFLPNVDIIVILLQKRRAISTKVGLIAVKILSVSKNLDLVRPNFSA